MKRIIAALLAAALLLALPMGAAAAKKVSIKFPAKVALMREGSTAKVKPTLKNIKLADLTWSSSDESVVAMSGNVASALAVGKAVVTATGGGKTAKCGVVVLPATVSLDVGDQVSLPYGGVEKYKVKSSKIASVSKKGVITGKTTGQTKLTVTYGKQKMTVEINVLATESQGGDPVAQLEAASQTSQIVLVEHTSGSKAVLSVHEKLDGQWVELYRCDAYLGKNGIGKTKEGDKKTPAGTYNLTTPFGIKSDPGAKLPYTKVTKYHYWCGTSDSGYYNQLVDEREVDRKHTSSDEYLIEYKGVYNYGMFIDYNAAGEAGKGSCIFLHCTGSKKYTSGCVAIPESAMKKIIQWVGEGAKIVIREQS